MWQRKASVPKVHLPQTDGMAGGLWVGGSLTAGHPGCRAVPCCSFLCALSCCSAGNWEKGNVSWKEGTTIMLDQSKGEVCCEQGRAGRYSRMKSLFSHPFCTLPQYKMSHLWKNTARSSLQAPALHPLPHSIQAHPSSLPVCPRAMRGEPRGRGLALSPWTGS